MVDPTKGIPPVPGVNQTNRTGTENRREKAEEAEARKSEDVVQISDEALSLQDIEKSTEISRRILETTEVSLGLDPDRLEE